MTQPKSGSLEVATQSPPNLPISLLGCSKSRPHSLLPPSTSTADVRHVPFLPYVTSKIAACPSSSSSSFDSHKRRTHSVESILAWTDRSLLLLGWHPIKSESSRNCFSFCVQVVSLCRQDHMRVVVCPEFSEKRQPGDVELFTLGNWLTHVLCLPEITLPVERTHVVEEDATLPGHPFRQTVSRILGVDQTTKN